MHLTSGWRHISQTTPSVDSLMMVLCIVKVRQKRQALSRRFESCGLELHPTKTKVVYCKDSNRKEKEDVTNFTFLGYTFHPRKAKGWKGAEFTSFLPAISQEAQKRIRQEIRKWKLKLHHIGLEEIAKEYNPIIQGWLNYYGKNGRKILRKVLEYINLHLVLWTKGKFKKLKRKKMRAINFLERITSVA